MIVISMFVLEVVDIVRYVVCVFVLCYVGVDLIVLDGFGSQVGVVLEVNVVLGFVSFYC